MNGFHVFEMGLIYVGEKNDREEKCLALFLSFLKTTDSVKVLDIIIDICDQIKCCEIDRKIIEKKTFRVLYNLCHSQTIDSLLEEKDRIFLRSFLGEFLDIKPCSDGFYIGNKDLCQLTYEEFFSLLVKAKYIKEKELQKGEAVN